MGKFTIPPTEYKLYDGIIEVGTGRTYDGVITKLTKSDYPKIRKTIGWRFTWLAELKASGREVYKLIIPDSTEIQGLISIKASEGFYEMYLVETAPHNYGKSKKYNGVLLSLTAFVCKKSFEAGFNGEIAFTTKSNLIEHYARTLHARLIYPPNRMAIFSEDAYKLVSSYFKSK